jgi:heat shock protein HslJ
MKAYRTVLWTLLAMLLAALPAQIVPAQDGQASLLDTVWRLERILYSDGKDIRPAAGNKYTLQFLNDQRVAGQADANRVMGSYTVSGAMLTIGPLASTRAADLPGSIRAEFMKALEQASSFRIEGDRLLVMLKADSGTMTFAREAPAGPTPSETDAAVAPLVGEWTLLRFNGRAVPAGVQPPTVAFDAGGGVSGSTGVNRYTTSADLAQLAEGRVVLLHQTAVTQMLGIPEAMQREKQFLDALRKVRVWKLSGRTLFLEDGRRALLVFRRRS